MISAKEARQKASDNIRNDVVAEFNLIEDKINQAIDVGSFEICENGTLLSPTVAKLEVLGYEVHKRSQYNEPYYAIKW